MAVSAGDIRATMTLDTAGFSSGVAKAQAELSTLTADGERVTNAFAEVESRAGASAAAIAQAMREAGQGSASLTEAAARADSAAAKMDALGQRAAEAAAKLAEAQAAARASGDALTLLEDSAAASAENLEITQRELEALKASGTATAAELQAATQSVQEFATESAELAQMVEAQRAAHEENNAAVLTAEANYRRLNAQLVGAEAAAEKANEKFAALTDTVSASGQGGLGGIVSTLATMGTSTLTSASRSLGTMAVNAAGLASNTAAGTLAARGLSVALRSLTGLLGSATTGYIGMGAAAAYGVYQLVRSRNEAASLSDALQRIVDESANKHYTAALSDVNLELSDEDAIKTQLREKIDHIFETLTDGKADTEVIVSDLKLEAEDEYASLRAQVDDYFKKAIEGAETSEAKTALQTKWDETMASIDAGEQATMQFVDTYAGQSTEICRQAMGELEEIYAKVEELVGGITSAQQLLNSQYGDAYRKVSGGYYATEQDVQWSLTYVNADHTNAQAKAQEEYETAIAALNDAFDGKDGAQEMDVVYEVEGITKFKKGTFDELSHQIETEYQSALDAANAEMSARWNKMIQGLLSSDSLGVGVREAAARLSGNLKVQDLLEPMLSDGIDVDALNRCVSNLDFFKNLGDALGENGFKLMKNFDRYMNRGDFDAAQDYLTGLYGRLEEAAASDLSTLEDGGLGEIMASAIEAGLFEGVEGVDPTDAQARLAILLGEILAGTEPEAELPPVDVTPEFEVSEADPPVVELPEPEYVLPDPGEFTLPAPEELLAEPVEVPVEPELKKNTLDLSDFLAAVEEKAAGGETTLALEPEVTLPSPAELLAQYGGSIPLPVEAELSPQGGGLVAAVEAMQAEASAPLASVEGEFASAGNNAGDSFVSAVRSHASAAAAAATAIGSAAYNALKASLSIHSPSQKMRQLGAYTGEGFALGISDQILLARQAITQLAGSTADAAASVTNNRYEGARSYTLNASVRNDNDLRRLSRQLARLSEASTHGIS